jgi:Na+/H+ antiporter NhaD/arsenite permease-like protein
MMTTQQWIALGIFVLSYGLIISEKVNRTIASIFGTGLAFIFILTSQDIVLSSQEGGQSRLQSPALSFLHIIF